MVINILFVNIPMLLVMLKSDFGQKNFQDLPSAPSVPLFKKDILNDHQFIISDTRIRAYTNKQ